MVLEKYVEILLVEDNPGDVLLTQEVLKEGRISNHVSVATDGEMAIDLLKKRGTFSTSSTPDLILLDLNLPKKSGREVLEFIKNDSGLKHIPVIVLTTSKDEMDILRSYQQHANCYITKPVDFDQFTEVVKKLEDFWFTIVKIPKKEN
jgi:CheY-like chemotaxis protein